MTTATKGYAPYVMMLLPTFGTGGTGECIRDYVYLGSADTVSAGWAALPMLAELAGYTRLPNEHAFGRGGWSNLYERDGRTWVGYWTSTDVAAADAVIYAPSAHLPTKGYRRWKVISALRILLTAGYPTERITREAA